MEIVCASFLRRPLLSRSSSPDWIGEAATPPTTPTIGNALLPSDATATASATGINARTLDQL